MPQEPSPLASSIGSSGTVVLTGSTTSIAVVVDGVFWGEVMPVDALRFASVAVGSMNDSINHVFATGAVGEVVGAVVQGVSVEVSDFLPERFGAVGKEGDQVMKVDRDLPSVFRHVDRKIGSLVFPCGINGINAESVATFPSDAGDDLLSVGVESVSQCIGDGQEAFVEAVKRPGNAVSLHAQ